jgi:caa(3)-type oxidase subunit IV
MANTDNNGKKESHAHHMVPMIVYSRVWIALIVFTLITVASSYIDFGGGWNILIAMLIATAKALLVILFFMGLRYEGHENNVTFFCSFVFLAIFVGLTASDLFYRFETAPAKVDATELAQGGAPVDVKRLSQPSPELLAKAQPIYAQQCATCHGPGGKGDGPAAAALTPKPRNFTSAEGWKNGRTVAQIFKTLTEGLPGTPMPPFSGMSAEDRFALVHYVRSLTPEAPADKPEALAALQSQLGAPTKARISIEQAMDRVSKEWETAHGEKK